MPSIDINQVFILSIEMSNENISTAMPMSMPANQTVTSFIHMVKPVKLSHVLVDEVYHKLIEKVGSYLPVADLQCVSDACVFADIAHIKDKRKSGEPYITHPIAVARILADYNADTDTLIAALLHDTIEDTEVTKADIIQRFGETVADLVDGVTKLKISKNKATNKAATFRKILTATISDARVIIIKMADRLHNMSTMTAVRLEKRISTSVETLEFYLPFARIMGLNVMADKLELLCFENKDAEQFSYFKQQLHQRQLARQHRQQQIQTYFYKKIAQLNLSGQVHIVDNDVHLYRAFFKHKKSLNHILNQFDFTIVLDTVSDCDKVLNQLKNRYKIETANIKDYIRKPYPGGYQALEIHYEHNNELIDLTIQTQTMYKASRLGVMLGDTAPTATQNILQASFKNLHELIDHQCAHTTLEALMEYFDKEKMLVFTPDNDVKELPIGATVIDFAYATSDFLGQHAISASIDGRPVTLAYKLKSGQKIAIETDPLSAPNAEWLGFVTTTKARKALQSWLKSLSDEEQVMAGKDALLRSIKDFYAKKATNIYVNPPEFASLLSAQKWQALFDWQQTNDKHTIYKRIATGDLLPQIVVSKLFANKANVNPLNIKDDGIIIGTAGVDLHYGDCCSPIMGDALIGLLTVNGLEVHRNRCYTALEAQKNHPEQVLPLNWNTQNKDQTDLRFNVILQINKACDDDKISKIIYRLHKLNAAVNDIFSTDDETMAYLMVVDRDHVAQITRELRAMLGFPTVRRLYRY